MINTSDNSASENLPVRTRVKKNIHKEVIEEQVKEDINEDMIIKECILSIDIGKINLGYAIVSYDSLPFNKNNASLEFGIYNITENSKKMDTVTGRCKALNMFLKDISKKYSIQLIIIERH